MGLYKDQPVLRGDMPKEIADLKEFARIMYAARPKKDDKGKQSGEDPKLRSVPAVKKIIIKKCKNNVTKFKLRTAKHLITFKATSQAYAEKMRTAIPATLPRVQTPKRTRRSSSELPRR